MEQEMQEKCDHTITMDPPPAYQNPSNASKSFLITIVTIALVTLLVVSFGVFYLMISGKSPAVVNVTASGDKPIVLTREVSFQLSDGVARHEQMIAEGNTLTIVNNNDGYTVVFDFERDLAVFKNRTTSSCYFIRLNDIPVKMKMDNLSAISPVFFLEAYPQDDEFLADMNAMVFRNLQKIPTGYIEATSAETCADGLSFWIEPTDAERVRNTRQVDCTPVRRPIRPRPFTFPYQTPPPTNPNLFFKFSL